MSVPENIDVLIVGAGPTGLMLGSQLGRRGIDALIVDRNPGPSLHTKALAVHARSLEIYAHLGIAEKALELGMRASAANLWVEGRRAARVPLGDIGRDPLFLPTPSGLPHRPCRSTARSFDSEALPHRAAQASQDERVKLKKRRP